MSDSDAEPPLPSAATIERALRTAVVAIFKSGNPEELTVKRVRTVAEQELDLPAEFLKTAAWKAKSHEIIHDQVDQCGTENAASSPAPEPSPPKRKPAAAKPTPKPKAALNKSKLAADPPRGVKRRSSAAKPKPQKRRKVVSSDEESDTADSVPSPGDSDSEANPAKPTRRANAKVKQADSDEDMSDASAAGKGNKASDVDDGSDEEQPKTSLVKPKAAASKAAEDVSESELSDVLDEPPTKKQRQKPSKSTKLQKASSLPKQRAPKSKASQDLDPEEAEIKQLQSQLVSCGIKKVWSRYLAQYNTPKAKISHLKQLLKDAGMDGRYTLEKAQKIKAKRELEAELDAVQEGAKAWGNSSDEGGRPRRRVARASKPVAPIKFDSDDSEEEQDAGDDDSEDQVEDEAEEDEDEVSEESAFSGSDSD